MKKIIACIFAHPDDEAFGPAGTIYKLAQENDVYILCVTKGDAGRRDPKENRSIAEIRTQELQESAKLLGVKKVIFLDFKDGTLCNNLYHTIAAKIEEKLTELKPDTILTFEPGGVSGHLDHIALAFITRFVFNKMPHIKTLLQYCIVKGREEDDYYIYFPEGYPVDEVDMIVDIEDVWKIKVAAIRLHHSQKQDAERIIKLLEPHPKKEHFFVINKK